MWLVWEEYLAFSSLSWIRWERGDSWGSWSSLTQSWPFWLIAAEVAVEYSGLRMWIRVLLSYMVWPLSVCIFSLPSLCFGHSLACERLSNSEKAQIPDLHFSVIVTIVNCIVRSSWPCCCIMVVIIGWENILAEAFKNLDRMHWTNVITTVIKTTITGSCNMLRTQEPQLPRVQIPEVMGINLVDLSSLFHNARYSLFYLACLIQVQKSIISNDTDATMTSPQEM